MNRTRNSNCPMSGENVVCGIQMFLKILHKEHNSMSRKHKNRDIFGWEKLYHSVSKGKEI